MLHIVLAIRDIKTNTYFIPQFVKSVGGFIRQLADEINQPQQPNTIADTMGKHPEDFEVFRLGTWEDEDATWTPEKMTQVCAVSALKK